MNQGVDFSSMADALLARADALVPQWLPGGTRRGDEYVCGDLSGGKGESCSVNLRTGKWADFAGDQRGGDLISLYAAVRGLGNGQAARELARDLGIQPLPVPPAPKRPATGAKPKSNWRPIVPVPAAAPDPDFRHFHYAAPEFTWAYRFGGQLFGYIARFRNSEGGKEILPHTWCVDDADPRGSQRWTWKQWEEPRPLYLPAGELRDGRSVVLVEGEKCADAGASLTDLAAEFEWVSWPGGSKAWHKAMWSWLAGRDVILWPDCDSKRLSLTPSEKQQGVDPESKPLLNAEKQPGLAAMLGIGRLLAEEHGCRVTLCQIPAPGDVADGWDIADAIEQGWDAQRVREFLLQAKPFDAAPVRDEPSTPSKAGAGRSDRPPTWRDGLLRTDKGAVRPVRENIVIALEGLPEQGVEGAPGAGGVIAYNEFTNDVIKRRDAPWGTPAGLWAEVDELKMGEWLALKHHLPSMPRGTLEEAVRIVAYNHRYHPVRAWLEGLQWDGQKRLHTWLCRACLEEDEWDLRVPLYAYLARVGTFFLQGMCARVIEPGVKFDWMLILEGRQGMRKSTLLRTLAGEYFADTGLDLSNKDSYQQLQGRWLYEFAELDSFGKAEVTKIKSFIASASDYFRASFDRRARDYPRQIVFGGTTNEENYLTDPTGNRRFWPVRVTRPIDVEWVQGEREQLFAEAMHRLRSGARMYPTMDEERELFEPQQQERSVENVIETAVARLLYDSPDGRVLEEITLGDLLTKIGIGVEKIGPGQFHQKQAAAALRRLGWVQVRSNKPGRPRAYRRPSGESDAAADDQRATQHDQPEGADSDCPF